MMEKRPRPATFCLRQRRAGLGPGACPQASRTVGLLRRLKARCRRPSLQDSQAENAPLCALEDGTWESPVFLVLWVMCFHIPSPHGVPRCGNAETLISVMRKALSQYSQAANAPLVLFKIELGVPITPGALVDVPSRPLVLLVSHSAGLLRGLSVR
ncbi:hypothetical protein NDU88_006481 [Pleurodeles waltl]|uniref:Uncharacterized protein n=1 Tax=Pleurodeles waltl TaxID=8319 RepID=A0AAV7RS55_PLEWA|nr:hypothetical protein NDU88_006481 [Pleurodeles waltl]